MTKLLYLRDSFSGLTLDTTKWAASGNPVVITDGAATMPMLLTTTTLTSVRTYDFTQSEVVASVTAPGAGTTRTFGMSVYVDANTAASIVLANTTLTFRLRVGGTDNDASVAFVAATMSHWRLFERAGIVQWMTSADGRHWTVQRTLVHGVDFSAVQLRFTSGFTVSDAGTAPTFGLILSVNNTNQAPSGPSTVPAIVRPVAPPRWQWAVGPWRDRNPSVELLTAGARSLSLHLRDPHEARFTTWGYAAETAVVDELLTDLWIRRNGTVLYRGRITTADDDLGTDYYSVACSSIDYRGLLDRRMLFSNFTFTGTEQADAAWQLLNHTQNQPNGSLGITKHASWPTTGVTRTVSFLIGDGVWDSISKLAVMSNGFDLMIDPATMVAQLYSPQYGVSNGQVLDFGGAVTRARRIFDPSKYANVVRQSGSSSPATTASVQTVSDIERAPEGRWEAQFGDVDLRTNGAVTDTAVAKLLQTSRLLPTYQLTLATGRWDGPGHVWLGDYVIVVVRAGRLNELLTMRVYDIDISVDANDNEEVTLTVGDPRVDVRSYLRGISKRVQALQKR